VPINDLQVSIFFSNDMFRSDISRNQCRWSSFEY
jgi:hypothetical protein